jgi:hypothetical protein
VSGPDNEARVSRRRYLRWAGSVAAVGLATAVLGDVAVRSVQGSQRTVTATDYQVATTTETDIRVEIQTDTDTRSVTSTQTVTATQTIDETQTSTMTDIQTQVQTVTDQETDYITTTLTQLSSSSSTPTMTTGPNDFSIFWITDTQFLSETNPTLYTTMMNWIVENWSNYNGKMVIHSGDIVETGDQYQEWQNAHQAMSVLVQNGIPYTWCAGNHDDLVGSDSTSGWYGNIWAPAFDPSTVSGQLDQIGYTKWVDDYHDGMNTAVTFTAGGENFLVVSLEWNAQPDALQWAGSILDDPQYGDYRVIIVPHAYLNAFGQIPVTSAGTDLTDFITGLNSLLDAHPNIFLNLNGHYASECGCNVASTSGGRNDLMFDRQDCQDNPEDPIGRGIDNVSSSTPDSSKVGGATVVILNFDMGSKQINVSTYDVYTGMWRNDSYENYSVPMFPVPIVSSTIGSGILKAVIS